MSVFTNPAARSRESAAEYVRAVAALVEGEDPLGVTAATPDRLARSLAGLSHAELTRPESPGKWSIVQVVRHLADSELVFGYRIRRILAEDGPTLEGYDQDLWAERMRYAEAELADSLRQFEVLRAANLRLLRNASDAELRRTGRHVERGEESLAGMLRLYAGHDIVHLRQIDRIRGRGDGS